MFEQIPSNLPVSREPEDILEKVAPVSQNVPPSPPASPGSLPRAENVILETPRQGMKRLVFVLGITAGIVIIGGASWFLISKSLKKQPVAAPEQSVQPPSSPAAEVLPSSPPAAPTTPPATSVVSPPATPPATLDTDGDGLSDAEEKVLGTNPNLIDSDNDGLTDYEEVKIYKTNPLNPDTDGDKYLDGDEVRHGYNPNGPGKLLTPPTP